MEIDDKISSLKKEIKQLRSQKEKGSFTGKFKKSVKALTQSTKQVFGELSKATTQVMDVGDVVERMPQ